MRALGAVLTVTVLVMCIAAACGASVPPAAEEPAVPDTLTLAPPAEGWQDDYLAFLDNCFDIFSALWPDGISGMGFVDLDLDGTPELVVFDQGASATMGAHLFDLKDGWVYCVSSALDSAAGAFTPDYLSSVSVCANFFESFRLSRTMDGWRFWVDSANGTMEAAWDEFVRFDEVDGILTPVSVCQRYLESDPESGAVAKEDYVVAGSAADQQAFQTAADRYQNAVDSGYEAKGVFRWGEQQYDTTTYEGFLALAQAAVDAYVPITDMVTQAVVGP